MAKTTKPARFVRNATRTARENFDMAKEKLEETKDATESLIKKHPLTSVAVAAAVGAIVALGVNALTKQERHPLIRKFRDYF